MTTNTLIKLIAPAALVAGMALPLSMASAADASGVPATCTVSAVGASDSANAVGSRFILNGLTVTGKFKVSGDASCEQTVTITTWQAPNGLKGEPNSEQIVYNHETATFGPGEHTITAQLPDCYYQVDLLRGASATAPNGSPLYPKAWLMSSLHGGTSVCGGKGGGMPSPVATPAPTPVITPAPTSVQTPDPTPLPDTGADTSSILGLASMTGAGFAYWRSRRNMRG